MELWYSVVIGTVAFLYIQFFNRTAKKYIESDRNLSLITHMGFEPMTSRLEGGRSIQLS
jgi:hypothetical protein